jgi:hypothetical protein
MISRDASPAFRHSQRSRVRWRRLALGVSLALGLSATFRAAHGQTPLAQRAAAPTAQASSMAAPGDARAEGPFRAAWDGETENGAIWTGWLSEAIAGERPSLLDAAPRDVRKFCPAYRSLSRRDREQFWIMLISAIAERESDFDEDAFLDEPLPLSERSIGLLQLSLSDSRDFGCAFKTELEIEGARENLRCGVQILRQLVEQDGVIGGAPNLAYRGAARYWAVLNAPTNGDARDYIRHRTRGLSECQGKIWPLNMMRALIG